MKYDEKDVPLFKEVICSHCKSYELTCKKRDNENNKHWFLMCPKYFYWVLGYVFDGMGYNKKVTPKRKDFYDE